MRLSVFFLIFWLVELSNHSSITLKEICVRPVLQVGNSKASSLLSRCIEWSLLLKNTSKYFVSYTKLRFLPGVYDLGKCLRIENVTNLMMTAYDANQPGVIIHCVAIGTCLSISNSTFIDIQNLKLQNCNADNESHLFSGEYAAILLYNVTSMVIVNITIQKSHGYGIIGINLMGNPLFINITILHKLQKRNNPANAMILGCLALWYYNNNYSHNLIHNILIENFTLHGIQEINNFNRSTAAYNLSAIEIAFHQSNPPINVTIVNANVSHSELRSGPLVSIMYCSSTKNYVTIRNSSFIRNVIIGHPII